ncbi:MAG: alpha/beta fold hydrolase [Pseudomonadota bacterium]
MTDRAGPAHVITLHGLWLTGAEATRLRRRLRDRHGYNVHALHYRTVRASLTQNARVLRDFMAERLRDRMDTPCHLVGHSLGGLVILKMLLDWPEAPPGRVVCLGTPLNGSESALRVAKLPGGESLLGRSIAEGVLDAPASEWAQRFEGRDVGVLAGTWPVGMGRLLGKLSEPNDGTVTVAETRWRHATDHLELAASHTTLVTSREVADQVAHFIGHGQFDRSRKRGGDAKV